MTRCGTSTKVQQVYSTTPLVESLLFFSIKKRGTCTQWGFVEKNILIKILFIGAIFVISPIHALIDFQHQPLINITAAA